MKKILTMFDGNENRPQYAIKGYEGDACTVNVYLYGETDPRLELPLNSIESESIEQAARRALKEFGQMLIDSSDRADFVIDVV